MKLALDLDEVVFDWLEAAIREFEYADGGYPTSFDVNRLRAADRGDYEWMADVVGPANWRWFWRTSGADPDFWRFVPVRNHEARTAGELAIDHNVTVLTSRPPAGRVATIKWMASLDVPFQGLFVVDHAEDKVGAAVGLGLEAIVDDRPSVIADAVVHNRTSFAPLWPIVYDQPWNQSIPRASKGDYTRVHSLSELRDRLEDRTRRLG